MLKSNKFFVESAYPDVLKILMADPVVAKARANGDEGVKCGALGPRAAVTKRRALTETKVQKCGV